MTPLKLRGERFGNDDEDYLVVSSKVQTELPHEDSRIDFHPVTVYKPKSKPKSKSDDSIEAFEPIVDPEIPILDGRRDTCFESKDLIVPVDSSMIFERNPLYTQSLANSAEELTNEYIESKKILSDMEARLTTEINDFNRDTIKLGSRQSKQRDSSTIESLKARESELSIRIRKWRRDEMALSAVGETFVPCYQQFSDWLTKKEEKSQRISLDRIFHNAVEESEGRCTEEDRELLKGYLGDMGRQVEIRRMTACRRLSRVQETMLGESNISPEAKHRHNREITDNLSKLRYNLRSVERERKNHKSPFYRKFGGRYDTTDVPKSASGWSELWKKHNPQRSVGGTQSDKDYFKKEGTFRSGEDDLDSEVDGNSIQTVIVSGGHEHLFSTPNIIPNIGDMSVEDQNQYSELWEKDRFTSTYGDWTSMPHKPSRVRSQLPTISEDK